SRSSPPVAASWPTPPGRAGRRTPSPALRESAAQRCPPCSSVCRELLEGRLLGSADLLGGGRGGLGYHLCLPVDRGPGEVENLVVVRAGHRDLERLSSQVAGQGDQRSVPARTHHERLRTTARVGDRHAVGELDGGEVTGVGELDGEQALRAVE